MKRTIRTLIAGAVVAAGISGAALNASAVEAVYDCYDPDLGHMVPCDEIVAEPAGELEIGPGLEIGPAEPGNEQEEGIENEDGKEDDDVTLERDPERLEDICDRLTPEQLEHAIEVGRCPGPDDEPPEEEPPIVHTTPRFTG